jgi:hypothetical protein
MRTPTKILLEAIGKLPEAEHYPYNRIQIPWMRFPVVFLESDKMDKPTILTFEKSLDGQEWELV